MADFEKVYSIEFRVTKALKNLEKLDKVLEKIEDNKLIKVFGSMERKLKSFEKQAAKTGRVLDKRLNEAAKRTEKNVDKIGKAAKRSGASLKGLGDNIKRYALLPMAAFGAASIKASLDINKAMGNVETLLSDKGAIQGLKTGVQDLAKETGKSTGDLADGLYQVVSALGESSDNMAQLKQASKAAVAGVAETSDAVAMLSAVGKGYNDVSAESLARTSDLAFQTVKLGVTTFPELAASMGKVVPLAAAMNTSQEELFGTMATLTGVTGNTSEVVTQLSSVYSAFMKPGGAMKDAMASINKENEEYNFSSASMMLKTLGLKKSLELLNKTADGNADALTAIFKRKEAVLAVLPLMSTQSENYTMKLKAMEDAVGATDDAYRTQTEGINAQGHAWEKTKQRMIVFAQRVGDRLIPIIEKIGDKLEPLIEYFENLDDGSIETGISIAMFATKMLLLYKAIKLISEAGAGIGSMFGAMGKNAGIATTGVSNLKGSMVGLQGMIAGVTAALAGGLALGTALWDQLEANEKKARGNANTAAKLNRDLTADELTDYSDESLSHMATPLQETVSKDWGWADFNAEEHAETKEASRELLRKVKAEQRSRGIVDHTDTDLVTSFWKQKAAPVPIRPGPSSSGNSGSGGGGVKLGDVNVMANGLSNAQVVAAAKEGSKKQIQKLEKRLKTDLENSFKGE